MKKTKSPAHKNGAGDFFRLLNLASPLYRAFMYAGVCTGNLSLSLLSGIGVNLGPPTLEHANVLLTGHGAGVMGVDHLHTGARVTRQGDQVYSLPIQQPKGNRAMPEAVKASRLAVRAHL